MAQFSEVTRKDLARGIDAFSARGSIPDGYAERLENVDTNANGKLSTRRGYEGYLGWVPLRVTKVVHESTTIRITFDEAQTIDLASSLTGPLVVAGRLSTGSTFSGTAAGDFSTTFASHWYSGFAITARDSMIAPSGTLTKSATQHGYAHPFFWTGLAESLSAVNTSNGTTIPAGVTIDAATYAVDVDYTISASQDAFVYFRDQAFDAGTSFNQLVTQASAVFTADAGTDTLTSAAHGLSDADAVMVTTTTALPAGLVADTMYWVVGATLNTFQLAATEGGVAIDLTTAGTGVQTWRRRSKSIPTVTHGLNAFSILVKAFDTVLSPGDYVEVLDLEHSIDTTGMVKVTFGADFTGYLELTVAPLAQTKATVASVTGGGPTTNTITISAPGGPFLFFSVYRYNASYNRFESVIVDDWSYDASLDEVSVSYVLSGASGEAIELYWVTGDVISNVIELTDSTGAATYTDLAPQLTVWGIDHANIYRDATATGGHVSHLDSYRRPDEARMVCGLGGNLFTAGTYEESGTTYSMGALWTDLRARADIGNKLSPLFQTTAPVGVVRTRGSVYDASITENRAVVTAASLVSSGIVDYTLTFAGKTGSVGYGTEIDAYDRLTVAGMANPVHTGDWSILSVQLDTATSVVLRVSNPNVTNLTQNEAGAAGTAGVFTDRFQVEATTNFAVDDQILTAANPTYTNLIVGMTGFYIYVDGVTTAFEIPDGLLVTARRTSDLVPLRTAANVGSITGFVRGDMLRISGLDRRTRVLYALGNASQSVALAGDGTTVTATTVSPHGLNIGQRFTLTGGSAVTINGNFVVTNVLSTVQWEYADTTLTGTATLQGHMLQLDESLTVEDGDGVTTFTVDGRWLPIEAPAAVDDLVTPTYVSHFDALGYDQQVQLRSTTIGDSMFLVNGQDEVMKFDGESVYRAGLPRWQCELFAFNNTGATATLGAGQAVAYTARVAAGKYFEVASVVGVQVGDRIVQGVFGPFVIADISAVETAGVPMYRLIVRPQDDISGTAASGNLNKIVTFKYAARLTAIDANDNIVATGVTGANDLVVDYKSAGAIQLKLVPPPAFDNYDYARIELELYRTLGNGAQFFLHTRQTISFDCADHYIYLVDSLADELLETTAPQTVDSAILGNELGTAWDQPPRAKSITTASNRLVLGNCKWYPEVDLNFQPKAGSSTIATADLAGKRFLFRRDSDDTGTSTDMLNRVAYEFVTTAPLTVSGVTASTTNFVVTTTGAHGLAAGDWVYLHKANLTGTTSKFSGWWQVFSVVGLTFTIKYNHDGTTTANDIGYASKATTTTDVPIYIGASGVDLNYGDRSGSVATDSVQLVAARRFANAIQASMRGVDRTVSGFSAFTPWLSASGGNDFEPGQVKVLTPFASTTTPELLPPSIATFQLFANNVLEVSGTAVGFRTKLFPSRLCISYANFPEIFDAPYGTAQSSDSVLDVNPADGQEITAVIPFFGESATSANASPLNQEVVVFKTNSIYLVNVETRVVQRIDSRGLGCTAPRSVAPTLNGIAFANPSGVYRLGRDMSVQHMGLMLGRKWPTEVAQDALEQATATHYGVGRRYKLSFPGAGELYCTDVFTYDYDREGAGQAYGAWTKYTAHAATAWANLAGAAYWGSQQGDVFLVRNRAASDQASDRASDFRDEDQAVAEQVITLRAEDFDLPGLRKVVAHVTTEVELDNTDLTNLVIEMAQNLSTTFEAAGDVTVDREQYQQLTFHATPANRRGNRIQVRYSHVVKDEELVLTAVAYSTSGISTKLIKQTRDFGTS